MRPYTGLPQLEFFFIVHLKVENSHFVISVSGSGLVVTYSTIVPPLQTSSFLLLAVSWHYLKKCYFIHSFPISLTCSLFKAGKDSRMINSDILSHICSHC